MADLNFAGLAGELLARSDALCREWFPAGKRRGSEFVIGDLNGSAGDSLSINLKTGVWADFATGETGGDLIALYAAMHRIDQGEAYKQLTNGHAPAVLTRPVKREPELRIILPVPPDAPACGLRHPTHGKPAASWCYRDQQGRILGHVARYDPPEGGRKQIVPWVWADGKGWTMKQFPEPRPLYGLDRLVKGARVIVVEGEKAADAAQQIVGERYAVVTWSGGAQALSKADLSPLEGRKVLLWPDADEPGVTCMQKLAERLLPVCPEVKVLDVSGQSDGWDAADCGFDWSAFLEWARPRAQVVTPPSPPATPPPPVPEKPPAPARTRAPKQTPPPPSGFALWDELGLALTDKGQPLMNLDNVVRAIENDPGLQGKIWYDEFLDSIVTNWQGPERKWADADDVLLQLYVQRYVGLHRVGVQTCHDAALVAAFRNIRNECKEWMESLTWDGVDRLRHLMTQGFGTEENAYTEAVGRCWIISVVARVLRPGCKVDTVPVLEGGQGAGKSTALQILGGQWFVECHESVTSKDFYGVLQGHMLVEISEMHSFTRAEVERIKGIISCQLDRYRKSYGRNTEDHKRQTVLVCTTNRDDWQRDDTGARRFWPVRCGDKVNHEWLRTNRDQLFAEAVRLFKDGVSWWDVPTDMQRDEVEARRDVDSWESVIGLWLFGQSRVSTSDILSDCLKIEVGRHDQMVQKRVGRVMRVLGWRQHVIKQSGRNLRAWVKDV